MASVNYKVPPMFSNQKPYNRWVEELKAWQTLTDLAENKQGLAVALSLPEEDGNSIRDKVFSELSVDTLSANDGVQKLITFMDNIFKKDELSEAYEVYTDFDRFKRSGDMTMEAYVTEFEKLYNKTKKFKMDLPESVRAFKLLEYSNLEMKDRQLVLTGVDYENVDTLFKQMRNSLKKFFGQQSTSKANVASGIKVEPSCMVAEEVNYAGRMNSYTRGRGFRGRGGRGQRYGFEPQTWQRYTPRDKFDGGAKLTKVINPNGPDGLPIRCLSCDSIRHLVKQCPHSYENMNKPIEKAVLFTGNKGTESLVLMSEARNSAVLDSACSATVAGEAWINCYLDSLGPFEKQKVIHSPSDTVFKFGGGTVLKSQEKVTFPCIIAGVECDIETDVVQSEIPLLLSKNAMKKARMKLDLENDCALVFGKEVQLQCTSSGHYCLPIEQVSVDVSQTAEALLASKVDPDKTKIIEKLHKQFAHPSAKRLKTLMKDAGGYTDEHLKCVDTVSDSCETCKMYKKTPARPVVSLPLATEFNEVVAVDLKQWKPGVYFLHMIDMATRFSLAALISRKTPEVIAGKIMTVWVGSGMGPPKKFLADNGGEFANEIFKDMCQNLNIEVLNTAGYSPWQNGICERNHAVVDDCVAKILEDQPKLSLEVALAWAVNAKNSLSMVYGWSPYQLVFGRNPNLPSVLTDKPPALENITNSEVFAKHLNALHSSRRAYIQAESSERIRRALRHQIRASKECFEQGDRVYYKRDDDNKWKGPGVVIGQDGKIVFVRHGSIYIRVHPCRLIRCGEEFQKPLKDEGTSNLKESEVTSGDRSIVDEDEGVIDRRVPREVGTQETAEHDVMPEDIVAESRELNVDCQNQVDLDLGAERFIPNVNDRITFRLKGDGNWRRAQVVSRGGKAKGKNRAYLNIQEDGEERQTGVDFVKDVDEWNIISDAEQVNETAEEVNVVVVPPSRFDEAKVRDAKRTELDNWKEFKVYDEVPFTDQRMMSTRWVVTEKVVDGNNVVKARLVVRGFEEENEMKTDSPTAHKETVRLFFTASSTLDFPLHTLDIKAAFLQGNNIEREIFVQPPMECMLDDTKIWKLNKCVYGLVDASRHWFLSVRKELLQLKCLQSKLDPALFYCKNDDNLEGLFLMHVDDFLWAGTAQFKTTVIDRITDKFHCGKKLDSPFIYIGLNISQHGDSIFLDQHEYIEELQQISSSSSSIPSKVQNEAVGKLHWIATQSRPDLSFDVLDLSTTNGESISKYNKKINKTIRKAKNNQYKMVFPSLGTLNNIEIVLYSDASYANLSDRVSSAGGFIVFLRGENDKYCPVSWSSKKINRVVRSTLAAEALALVEGIDSCFYLRSILKEIIPSNSTIPITCLTDNKSLYQNINSTKLVSEKRLRLDLASIKESVSNGEVRVDWIQTSRQISDCMTKSGSNFHTLVESVTSGIGPG